MFFFFATAAHISLSQQTSDLVSNLRAESDIGRWDQDGQSVDAL